MKLAHLFYNRVFGYLLGVVLFFGPVAIFQRIIAFIAGKPMGITVHSLCIRIPIEHLFSDNFFNMGILSLTGISLLFISSFFRGPIFCGRLCPVGAAPEYLSKMIPDCFKINWGKSVPIVPVRYGFLLGFVSAPFMGVYLACAYCNFYVFDLLFNYVFWGYTVAFSSSLLLTLILWLGIFGIFSQGGRGFCNFFCPLGAIQSLVYAVGRTLSFSWSVGVNETLCNKCGRCVKICPMTSLSLSEACVEINLHNCIVCHECVHHCPSHAIVYQRSERRLCRAASKQ